MANELISFKKLEKEHLPFLNEVRNMVSDDYLHDSRKFSLEETHKWFERFKPDYYIIMRGNENIGYFRLSNHSEQNKNIYVGADIHPKFQGNGYAKIVYPKFISYLFECYCLHKISLEVLASNERAISLYSKIGFKFEGKKRQDVNKNGVYVDSIIMSILENEWTNS